MIFVHGLSIVLLQVIQIYYNQAWHSNRHAMSDTDVWFGLDNMTLNKDELDDFSLSQVLDNYEASLPDAFDLDDSTLSQALDNYELTKDDLKDNFSDLDIDNFGTFDIGLLGTPKNANHTVTSANSRFGKQSTLEDIENIEKQQESKNTRKNTTWGFKVFEDLF